MIRAPFHLGTAHVTRPAGQASLEPLPAPYPAQPLFRAQRASARCLGHGGEREHGDTQPEPCVDTSRLRSSARSQPGPSQVPRPPRHGGSSVLKLCVRSLNSVRATRPTAMLGARWLRRPGRKTDWTMPGCLRQAPSLRPRFACIIARARGAARTEGKVNLCALCAGLSADSGGRRGKGVEVAVVYLLSWAWVRGALLAFAEHDPSARPRSDGALLGRMPAPARNVQHPHTDMMTWPQTALCRRIICPEAKRPGQACREYSE